MKKLILTLLFLLVQTNVFAFAESNNDLQQNLQKYVNRWRLSNDIPGAAVSIYRPDIGFITVVSGKRIRDLKDLVNNNTQFQIGSITKTFTAVAILTLEAQGKLSINDKIGSWFPEYPRWKNITIKQLLNMTSGIAKYEQNPIFAQLSQKDPKKNWTVDELLTMAYQQPDPFQPGTNWYYSNTNYLLAGKIIEKVTDKPLATAFDVLLLKNHDFLAHTKYIPDTYDTALMTDIAHGYKNDNDVTAYSMSAFGAAGAMISTSEDIAKWTQALFTGAILKPMQLQEFMTTVPFNVPPKPQDSRFGLGIYLLHSKQYGNIWWYSGVTNGYISLLMYLPQYKLIVTSTINQINDEDYWVLMPNRPFVLNILNMLLKK